MPARGSDDDRLGELAGDRGVEVAGRAAAHGQHERLRRAQRPVARRADHELRARPRRAPARQPSTARCSRPANGRRGEEAVAVGPGDRARTVGQQQRRHRRRDRGPCCRAGRTRCGRPSVTVAVAVPRPSVPQASSARPSAPSSARRRVCPSCGGPPSPNPNAERDRRRCGLVSSRGPAPARRTAPRRRAPSRRPRRPDRRTARRRPPRPAGRAPARRRRTSSPGIAGRRTKSAPGSRSSRTSPSFVDRRQQRAPVRRDRERGLAVEAAARDQQPRRGERQPGRGRGEPEPCRRPRSPAAPRRRP